MNKEMIVSSNDHETMVAILEDDQVVELFIERERNRGVVGNIYKGRVSKVLPGMQSAFVDLGLERDGFLYVTDVVSTTDQFDQLEASDGEAPVAADVVQPSVEVPGERVGRRARRRAVADTTTSTADDAALIEEPDDEGDPESERVPEPAPEPVRAAVPVAAAVPVTPVRTKPEKPADRPTGEPTIDQLLKEGQEVVVQVVKEPLGTKGARITCHASIPGRFLVFMPTVDHVGVSRKIESRDERAPAARHRPAVPRAAQLHRRGHHPHRRVGPARGRHPRRPQRLPPDLAGDPPQAGGDQGAVGGLPRAEPRRQAAARPADRGVPDHPHRQPGRVPQGAAAGRADDAGAAAAREAVHEGLPDLRGVRRPQRDRQGAAQQGLAQVGRLHRHQPDRGAGRDRRQHRALRRQEDRAARGHHRQDQPRGGARDRAPAAPARPRRHHRARLHRHGGAQEPAEGLRRPSSRRCAAIARRRRRSRSPSSG